MEALEKNNQFSGKGDLMKPTSFFSSIKVMIITSKYTFYILPILLMLFFAGTASALPTTTHGTVRGEMYVSSTSFWPSAGGTGNFNVPNGTVVYAQYYLGVWKGQGSANSMYVSFNGHAVSNQSILLFIRYGCNMDTL